MNNIRRILIYFYIVCSFIFQHKAVLKYKVISEHDLINQIDANKNQ